jgi:globin
MGTVEHHYGCYTLCWCMPTPVSHCTSVAAGSHTVCSEQRLETVMPADTVANIYDIIGADGIMRLTAAFYRLVSTGDILRPLYPEADLRESEARLRDFLIFRFGGPPGYIEQRGTDRKSKRPFRHASRPHSDSGSLGARLVAHSSGVQQGGAWFCGRLDLRRRREKGCGAGLPSARAAGRPVGESWGARGSQTAAHGRPAPCGGDARPQA